METLAIHRGQPEASLLPAVHSRARPGAESAAAADQSRPLFARSDALMCLIFTRFTHLIIYLFRLISQRV